MEKQMVTLNQKYDSNLHLEAEIPSWTSAGLAEVYPCSWREEVSMYTPASKLWGRSHVVPLNVVLG